MKIGVIGTGIVGQTLSGKLSELGHDVVMGTRDIVSAQRRTEPGSFGAPPFSAWLAKHPRVRLETFAGAAAHGEAIINATNGSGSLPALHAAGEANLNGKILMDIANPLDFSRGMPPSLTVCNTDSLGEQIQRAFPNVRVVKTLNTVNALVMINPAQVGGGDHHLFVCGNDTGAKETVTGWLKSWFGWKNVVDLGDITNARGVEMLLPVWVRLMGTLKTPMFNFKIVL
jgi:8-hydroxy-5-deazaflavin:NADPH oxidoreductase